VLKSSHQYFNFKNEFLGSKYGEKHVFIIKSIKVKSYCLKLNVRNEKMVAFAPKNSI